MNYTIPLPDPKIFENHSSVTDLIMEKEGRPVPILEKIEYEPDGIRIFKVGALYPEKGFPYPEAIFAINIIKKTVIQGIRILHSWQFIPAVVLIILFPSKPLLNKILDGFNRICNGVMEPHFIKYKYRMDVTNEVMRLIMRFMENLGFESHQSWKAAKTFAHIIEYDTAYRYRLLDIMSESSKGAWMVNPRKEIKRLIAILKEREPNYENVGAKIERMLNILSLLLLSPKINKALKKAFSMAIFTNFKYDEIDRYWCMLRSDYNYMGKTFEERMAVLDSVGIPFPPLVRINKGV